MAVRTSPEAESGETPVREASLAANSASRAARFSPT
jgi:hypothetical protein